MKLTNGKETVEIMALGAINGYINAGWKEVKGEKAEAPEKKPATKKTAQKK